MSNLPKISVMRKFYMQSHCFATVCKILTQEQQETHECLLSTKAFDTSDPFN